MSPPTSLPSSTSPSTVYLVGAGPGDPGLLTVKGATLLALADVVVYDALANPKLLLLAPKSEKVYVGKRAASHSMTQDQINRTLVDLASRHKAVVRLKGGDPFVFGRGGEECEALHAAGVPFEVVPGVTAAIAATAYAGIPVTHRDFNSSFTFLTGHEKDDLDTGLRPMTGAPVNEDHRSADAAGTGRRPVSQTTVDWSAIAKLPCVAFYMGVKSLPRICRTLIDHGMDPATPAATIQSGTLPNQRTVVGTVADLPGRVVEAGLKPPALTIIGRVVSLRPTLNWFETKPLFGKTIVVTRAREQASDLSAKLEAMGATVIEAPAIELTAADSTAVDRALTDLAPRADWVVFTSANGVRQTRDRLFALGSDARAFARAKVAAVGAATADAVRNHLALKVDVCPDRAVSDALADELGDVTGKRLLLLRADIARPALVDKLTAAGGVVDDVPIYESRPVTTVPDELRAAIDAGSIDWITFTSGSTVKNFLGLIGAMPSARTVSIGPVTTAAMKEFGIIPTVQAATADLDAVVAAIVTS